MRFTENKSKATAEQQEHVHRHRAKRRWDDIRKRPKRSTESGRKLALIDPDKRTIKLPKQPNKDDVVAYRFVDLPKYIKN